MTATFVHLRLHTEYSISDGIVKIKPLMQAVAQARMPAVAITDQSNLFGMVKFYRAAVTGGIKPIIGSDIWLENPAKPEKPYRLTLLCQNQQGYKNLTYLISKAYTEGQKLQIAIVQQSWLTHRSEGLIALSGAKEGDIGQNLLQGKPELARKHLQHWLALFTQRFYLELQRTQRPGEEEYIQQVLSLAEEYQVPVVATNDVRFIAGDDFEAHEARVCIHEGKVLADPQRTKNYSEQQYLRTPAEMQALFADIPAAISNTLEIAKRCNLVLEFDKYYLPNFPVPDGMSLENYFAAETKKGLDHYFSVQVTSEKILSQRQLYEERLQLELSVINKMGFAGYFLIVADFIQWAKNNAIPVGPGRGSGAGSLVAFVLGITGLDPLEHDLLFERFLNPERVSMPDFDIDFCMEGRDRVIDYVAQAYGRESVSQIITYGTMAAKAVVRDVGRVLDYPYGFVDKIAKLVPFELGMTLAKALDQEVLLRQRYQEEEEVKALIDLALKLEGVTRNAGKHAGGVVIAPSKLTDFTPLYCEPDSSNLVTQFDKDDVEAVGLVKFDFLGLRTLTIIDWAVQTINQAKTQAKEPLLDINQLELEDKASFALLKACRTTAIFQLESRGMKDLIRRLQPDCFEEIVALVALFRPGPLQSGMVDDFIDRKHGRAKVVYPHPKLEAILRPTYGVILYQEQVMQIAQVLAGYSLGSADILRRAMGKKKPEEMAKQRAIFVKGATEQNVEARTANTIFDLMEKFAGYGFNKSHSAAYALLSYQTAWLKAHYPAEFMAAVLSSDMDNTDKVVAFIEECKALKIKVSPPDLNQSYYKFTVNETGICFGLGAIKGVGEAAIDHLIQERDQQGVFQSLFDFCRRVDGRKVNRRVLEALIRSGALDGFRVERANLWASIDTAIQLAEQHHHNQQHGQVDLFGGMTPLSVADENYIQADIWSDEQRLVGEKETLGFYLTGHPLDAFRGELSQFINTSLAEVRPDKQQMVLVAGFVATVRTMNTKRGDRIAFLSLDDYTARLEVAVFSDIYNDCREFLVKDQLLIVEGEVGIDDFNGGYKLTAKKVFNLEQARQTYARYLLITLKTEANSRAISLPELQQILVNYKNGACPVFISYESSEASSRLALGSQWSVQLKNELIIQLENLLGKENVNIHYRW